jgi:hypothetical protein
MVRFAGLTRSVRITVRKRALAVIERRQASVNGEASALGPNVPRLSSEPWPPRLVNVPPWSDRRRFAGDPPHKLHRPRLSLDHPHANGDRYGMGRRLCPKPEPDFRHVSFDCPLADAKHPAMSLARRPAATMARTFFFTRRQDVAFLNRLLSAHARSPVFYCSTASQRPGDGISTPVVTTYARSSASTS